MELLKEFTSLHKFKDWWQRVQSGRDKPQESQSKFRHRFVDCRIVPQIA
jgi:DNA excision repair protein ERCC-5